MKKKTFFYVVQVKNKGRTDARVFRIAQGDGRQHKPHYVGNAPFFSSRPPKPEKQIKIISSWLFAEGCITKDELDGGAFYLEAL
jgi:hypothetical protein